GGEIPAAAGASLPREPGPAVPGELDPKAAAKRRKWRVMLLGALVQVPIVIAVIFFVGKGCGVAEGSLVAQGQPFGDFTFKAVQCRSGERMNFFGAVVLGNGPNDGGVIVGDDPLQGRYVKIEVPGSCKPPDLEVCTEILVDKTKCSIYEPRLERTNTTVNDIRLIDGSLKLQCAYPEGGTLKAELKFESCD
ncbi:MAG TPA: hypothetical protein P5076_04095, partial [Myxococcota bacterium]|nr:hypothetical protein [Myxococcota bacterium]